jgi:A/G-specific adenine glycosylase
MKQFSQQLLLWYNKNYRELPWRSTSDPYLIWISEIILQQTRVNQGLAYYHRFIEKWPTVTELAAASEQEVLKIWQGLGYYSRARNLLSTARSIMKEYHGEFPRSSKELMRLKGIGKYTAAAIASNAFNEKVAVVDGNVLRFISRLVGIVSPVNSSASYKSVQQFVDENIEDELPGNFNQAIMEFGALHCVPQRPNCIHCPFSTQCYAFQYKIVADLPAKKQKIQIKSRYLNYLLLMVRMDEIDYIYLHERTENDIWKGLYQFPLIETIQQAEFDNLVHVDDFKQLVGDNKYTLISTSTNIKHQLTHQTLYAKFYILNLKKPLKNDLNFLSLVSRESLGQYPLPRLIDRYLHQHELPAIYNND